MADDEAEYVANFVQADDAALMAAIAARDAEVTPQLKPGGSPAKALALSLADPPYQTRTADVKNASFDVVCKALVAVKDADIAAVVETLSLDECDVLMKATKVDGVYSADPKKDPDAKRYETLYYSEVLMKDLKVMDGTAITMYRDHSIPVVVFDMFKEGNLEGDI